MRGDVLPRLSSIGSSLSKCDCSLSWIQEVAVLSKDREYLYRLTSGIKLKFLMWEPEVGVISFKFRCLKARHLNPCLVPEVLYCSLTKRSISRG